MQRTERVLQVGVIQKGLLVSQYLMRDKNILVVGSNPTVDVRVEGINIPKKFNLFIKKGSKYYLKLLPGNKGKIVTFDGKVYTPDQLVNSEFVRIEGGGPVVELERISRGKITFGDTTFLFKYVDIIPPPQVELPPAEKDWNYIIILMISLTVVIGLMYFMATVNLKENKPNESLEAIPARFAQLIVEKKEEPKKVKVTESKVATKSNNAPKEKSVAKEEKPVKKQEKASKSTGTANRRAKNAAARRAAIRKKVRSVGVLAILTSKGSGGGGVADVISTGANVTGNLDKVLSEVGGVSVAKSKAEVLAAAKRSRGAGPGRASVGDLAVGPGENIGLGTKKVKRVRSRIITGAFSTAGSLDSGVIGSVVKREMGGIKYCYEKGLKKNPKLSGKIVVEFVIGINGSVQTARVVFSSMGAPNVERCIVRRVTRFRFPKPKKGSVKVNYPFIFTSGA